MKVNNLKLDIFNGKIAPSGFMEDLEVFLNLEDNLKKEIIQNTFSWYPKGNIDEEWSKWMGKRSEEEKKRLAKAVRLVLFTMKTGLMEQFADDLFTKELEIMGFNSNLIEFFLKELNKNRENLVQEVGKIDAPVIAGLHDIKWRVDIKKSSTYSRRINEPCVILRMSLSGTKSDEIVFELSYEEINSLMRTFSLIQKEIAKFEVEEEE